MAHDIKMYAKTIFTNILLILKDAGVLNQDDIRFFSEEFAKRRQK